MYSAYLYIIVNVVMIKWKMIWAYSIGLTLTDAIEKYLKWNGPFYSVKTKMVVHRSDFN